MIPLGLYGAVRPVTASTFDPLSVNWSHALWVEDPAWTPPSDGSPVAAMPNASGGSGSWAQTDGTRQPLYRAAVSALNNRPALHFDGSNDWLVGAGFVTVSQPFAIFAVVNLTKTANSAVISAGGGSTTQGIQTDASSVWTLSYGVSPVSSGIPATTGAKRITAALAGASSTFDVNGASAALNPGTNVAGTTIGSRNPSLGFGPFGGHIAFIGTKATALTVDEIADLVSWADEHYGIEA